MRPVLAALALFCAAAAPAQDTPRETEWNLTGGYGHTVHFVAADETSDHLALFMPTWGLQLSRVVEYVAAGHFAGYFGDAKGYFLGVLPVGARFQLPQAPYRPYFVFQAGFGWTDLEIIEINRRFNYILTGGFGLRWPRERPESGLLEIRLVHYSNAGTVLPNYGLNSIALIAGWRLH
jgi:Lipid A 3-O-deacylase (PagL)